MKKILIIFMILLSILVIGNVTVYANDDDPDTDTTPAWPKEYTHEDYKYTITGVVLNVYKIDASKTVETQGSGESAETDNEDFDAYLNEQPTRVVTLDPSKYTLNPEYKTDKIGETNTEFIDLNLKLTKEQLEELLEEEMQSATSKISYMVDIAVKFKLTDYPENYKYFYRQSLLRGFFFSALAKADKLNGTNKLGEYSYNPSIDIEEETSQMINMAFIGKTNDEDETELRYETNLENEEAWVSYLENFTILSEENINVFLSDDETDLSKIQLLMFHDVDDVDHFIQLLNGVSSDSSTSTASDLIDKVTEDQQVEVPNTGLHKNLVWIMLGIITVLTGIIIISYTLKMRQFKQFRKQETI